MMLSPGFSNQPTTVSLDRDFHVVLCRAKDGSLYLAESEFADENAVIVALGTDEFAQPRRIFAFNPVEGWARDVSEDCARALACKLRDSLIEPTSQQRDFIEQHCGFAE
jgi:hypothetical protein